GGAPINSVEAYILSGPGAGTWVAKTALPGATTNLSAVVGVDNRVYVFGGSQPPATTNVQTYRPETDTWLTGPVMNTARAALGTAIDANGNLYALGGDSGGGPFATADTLAVGPLLAADSTPFDVGSASANKLVVTLEPSDTVAGQSIGFQVT